MVTERAPPVSASEGLDFRGNRERKPFENNKGISGAQIGWEAELPPPSPHTTGRTVPYHGGWNATLVFRHRL